MNLEKRLKALRKRYKADKKKLIEEYLRDTSKRTVCAEDGEITIKRGSPEYLYLKGMKGKVREVDNKPLANNGFLEFDKIPEYVSGLGISYIHESADVDFDGYKYELIIGKVKGVLGICKRKIS